MKRRVVVTGMGIVSPLGSDVDTFWSHIVAGRPGIVALSDEAFSALDTRIAGRVAGFDGARHFDAKSLRTYSRVIQYGCAAALQALEQSGLAAPLPDSGRAGVYIGSGAGGLEVLLENHRIMLERGPGRVSPHLIPMSINNMVSGVVAIRAGFRGPGAAPVSACATGNHSIGEAFRAIAHGYADVMLAGGAEAPVNPLYFAAFGKMRALSTRNADPARASRPFDRSRDGFVMAEGAGVLMLEASEHALARGARILAEVAGYGSTTDAHHVTAPSPDGAARAMALALQEAGLSPGAVDYINAHGTGTPVGDVSEADAIRAVFADRSCHYRVGSTKSMTGHMFGAAGGAEAVVSVCSLLHGIYPPAVNLDEPDPACALNHVANTAVPGDIRTVLSNGFGFGGQNAVLAFRKFD